MAAGAPEELASVGQSEKGARQEGPLRSITCSDHQMASGWRVLRLLPAHADSPFALAAPAPDHRTVRGDVLPMIHQQWPPLRVPPAAQATRNR